MTNIAGMTEICKQANDPCLNLEETHYPYGTSLNIRDQMLVDLGADNLNVGDVVEIKGVTFVESVSSNEDKLNSNKTIELQFTHISIYKSVLDKAEQLYG